MLEKIFKNEKVRFLFIGGINTLIAYGFYVAFFFLLGENLYVLAYVFAYIITLFIGFTLQRNFVFKVKGKFILDFSRYSLVQLASFLVNLGLLPLLVEIVKIQPLVAQAFVLVITVVGSYFAHRYFSFRRRG